jgi:hypothetical protein
MRCSLDVARHAKRSKRSLYRGMAPTPCLRRSLPYKTLQTLRQRRSALLLPIARWRFGRYGSFVPPPKTNDASKQLHVYPLDGRIAEFSS